MRIFIPSKGRANISNIAAGPLSNIPVGMLHLVSYVVPEEETDNYVNALTESGHREYGVMVIPTKAVGISNTRYEIGKLVHHTCSDDKFIMLDDDITFVKRIATDSTKLQKMVGSEFNDMYELVNRLLDTHSHVGISPRQGNNRLPTGGPDEAIAYNTRTLRALCYRASDFVSVEHGRVPVMEDFDVNLQLLRKGSPNANIGYYSQDQSMTNAPGGCSTYRDHEMQTEAAHKLKELHPDYVAIRNKQNKTDKDGFGTRTEVTIYWKKAFKNG